MTLKELKKWKCRAEKCVEIYKNNGKDTSTAKVTIPADKFLDLTDTAIKALEQQPCEDVVRRLIKDKINTLEDIASTENSEGRWVEYEKCCYAIEVLEKLFADLETLPYVTPKEKTGHWIKYGTPINGEQHYQCTNCKWYINFGQYGDIYTKQFKYCPNCKARIVI